MAAQIFELDSAQHHHNLLAAIHQLRSLGSIFYIHLNVIKAFCLFSPKFSFPLSNLLWNFWFGFNSNSGFDFGFSSRFSFSTVKCSKFLLHDLHYVMLILPVEFYLRKLCFIIVGNTLVMLRWMHLNSFSNHFWKTYFDSIVQS